VLKNVTILMPAYSEDATIIQLLKKVKAVSVEGFALEVLVSDDGPSDRKMELLDLRPDPYTRSIKRPRNGVRGAAVIDGLSETGGQDGGY